MSAIAGTFQYRAADVRRGLRRMLRGATLLALASVVGISAVVAWSAWKTGAWPLRDPLILLAFAGGLGAIAWGRWIMPRRMSLAYERKFGGRDVTARFDEAGFELDAPGRLYLRHEWAEIERVRESDGVLLVHLSQDLPYLVPTRAFAQEDLDRLRELARGRSRLD